MKRIISMLLITILLLSLSSMSFGDEKRIELTYSVADHYTVTIPDSMPFGGGTSSFDKDTAEMTIFMEGNISEGVNVSVTPQNEKQGGYYALLLNGNDTQQFLHYRLFVIGDDNVQSEVSENSNSFVLQNNSPKIIQAKIVDDTNLKNAPKGDYKDTLTFTIG